MFNFMKKIVLNAKKRKEQKKVDSMIKLMEGKIAFCCNCDVSCQSQVAGVRG